MKSSVPSRQVLRRLRNPSLALSISSVSPSFHLPGTDEEKNEHKIHKCGSRSRFLIPDFSHFFHVWLLAISLIFQLGVAVYKKILKEQQVLQFCQNSSPRERFTGLVREYREAAERHCPHWLQQRLLHRLHPCLHGCLQHMAKLQADWGTG